MRLVFLLRRRAGLSLQAFQAHWRDEHGPMVASYQTRLGILRYTQTHRLDDPLNAPFAGPRGQMEDPYDGVAELWWESEEALAATWRTSAGRRAGAALLADEAAFIDLPSSPLWLAHEYPQFSQTLDHVVARPSSGIVKMHFPVRHRQEMSLEEAQRYWHTVHGPLARSMAPVLQMIRYQQVHRVETPIEAALREARGTVVDPYTGHAELWWDRLRSRSGAETVELRTRAVADEARFIDFARSSLWIGKEHVFIDRW